MNLVLVPFLRNTLFKNLIPVPCSLSYPRNGAIVETGSFCTVSKHQNKAKFPITSVQRKYFYTFRVSRTIF
jgi:hypothetical protein